MTLFKNNQCAGATLAAAVLLLASFAAPAASQEPALAALLARAQIEDMLADYYALFGGADRGFASYYTDAGVLDVNGIVRRGHKAIDELYAGIPPDHGRIHVIFTNTRIVVNGDTATEDLVWTEFISESHAALPHVLEQGRDHGELVKRDGRWLFKYRVVTNDGGLPPSLEKYYKQR